MKDVAWRTQSCRQDRFSAAFFVDVDEGVTLRELGHDDELHASMTVAEYIRWRSGSGDGVAFHPGVPFVAHMVSVFCIKECRRNQKPVLTTLYKY